jgi:hypothetical protein
VHGALQDSLLEVGKGGEPERMGGLWMNNTEDSGMDVPGISHHGIHRATQTFQREYRTLWCLLFSSLWVTILLSRKKHPR